MTDKPEVMNGESLDIAAQRRAELKQLFPGVFTETKDANGKIVSSIDFERLKAELGTFSDLYEGRRERYGMEWPGKRECMKVIQQPSRATLKPCPDESIDWDTTKNLFIEGDNLEVLKLLQKSYYGKVKMIYIDPPYNTGNEFIYPDNYQETLDTYLSYAGMIDGDGNKYTTNTKSEGRFHSKWMNMMFPRLYLARSLLSDDGMIFVSIDDNEVENLRRICDEVFGEENRVDCIVWKKRYGGGAKEKHLVTVHEYILVYAKSIETIGNIETPLSDESIARYYTSRDQNFSKRGPYRTHPLEAMKSFGERQNLVYPFIAPDGSEIWPKRQWRWSKETADVALSNGEVEFVKVKDGWTVHSKQYLKHEDGSIRTAKAFSIIDDVYSQHGTNEIVKIFGNAQIFPFPKPTLLLEKLVTIGTQGIKDCIVMDFFAGSGGLGEVIYNLNSQDNGSRKFILVQLPEPIDSGSEAGKLGYSKIPEITRDRLRKAVIRLKRERECQGNVDLGFKSFSLASSCFKEWQVNSEKELHQLQTQLDLNVNNIVEDKCQEEILFEILLKAGFEPTETIVRKELNGKIVYFIENGALLVCLEEKLTAEFIDEIIKLEPMQFICLDKGFQDNDQLKANTAQAFKARSEDSETEMVFKVV